MKQTRAQLEAAISQLVVQFSKEHLGRGPEDARTHIFGDIVFVRLYGVLTKAERHLADQTDGARLIKEMRTRLVESSRVALAQLVAQSTGCSVVSLHTDLSVKTGEEIIVLVMDQDLQQILE